MNSKHNPPQATEELIDLRAIWQLLSHHKWRLLMLAALVSFISALVALQMTPIYRATSTLLIETSRSNILSIEEIYGLDTSKQEYLLTQFEILKSTSLAERVVDSLQLQNNPHFMISKPSLGDSLRQWLPFLPKALPQLEDDAEQQRRLREQAVRQLKGQTSIQPIRRTQLVQIAVESTHPELAQLMADEIGRQYIEADLQARLAKSSEANDWLESRLVSLSLQLVTAEEAINQFRQDNDIVDVEGIKGLVNQRLIELTQRIARAEDRANQAEAVYQIIEANRNQPIDVVKNISIIASADSVRQISNALSTARARLEELQKTYGPRHPNILRAQAEISSFENDLAVAVRELANNAERDLNASREELRRINLELRATRAEFQTLTTQESEFRRLVRNVETNRSLYDTFLSRIKETELAGDFGSPIARFTDQAALPQFPIKPNKKLIVALAFMGTLGLGVVVVFLLDALNDTVRSPDDVERKLRQRIVSALPTLKLKRRQELPAYQFFDPLTPGFAEAVRTLRTALSLSKRDKQSKIIAVTSTLAGEGKSTTALNLALSLGQVQKTLLIDADLRKPSLGRRLGFAPFTPGLTDLLNDNAELTDCIVRDEKDCMDILLSGQYAPNPLELLSGETFAQLLAQLATQYERIIIDTPPAMAVSDALVIAEHSDSVLYVIKEDSTRIKPALEGIGRVLDAHAHIGGVVLNKVSAKRGTLYAYGGEGQAYGDNYQQAQP